MCLVPLGYLLGLLPDRATSPGRVEAEAPVMVLAYQPPALFPAAYAAPSYIGNEPAGWRSGDFRETQFPGGNEDTSSWWKQQNRFDSDWQADPIHELGETIAIETIVTVGAVERSELHAAGFVPGGRADLPLPPITTPEARAILGAAGWPEEWIADILVIGACESSGGRSDAAGALFHPGETGDGGNSLGWLQLWSGWFRASGEDVDRWWDPLVNARVGLYVRQVRGHFGGPGGWSCADRNGIG